MEDVPLILPPLFMDSLFLMACETMMVHVSHAFMFVPRFLLAYRSFPSAHGTMYLFGIVGRSTHKVLLQFLLWAFPKDIENAFPAALAARSLGNLPNLWSFLDSTLFCSPEGLEPGLTI